MSPYALYVCVLLKEQKIIKKHVRIAESWPEEIWTGPHGLGGEALTGGRVLAYRPLLPSLHCPNLTRLIIPDPVSPNRVNPQLCKPATEK